MVMKADEENTDERDEDRDHQNSRARRTDKEERAEAVEDSPADSVQEKITDMGQPSVQKGSEADPGKRRRTRP
ncbi:hypothetical protein BH23VER1_BH23VER1_27180 [soil metagenome]